jgi:hypothetical protein
MEINESRFDFCLSEQDRQQIRDGIRKWGKPHSLYTGFNGGRLYNHFEAWDDFVEMNWKDWDFSEYDYDIECRYWIQLSIEYATPVTKQALESAVAKADAKFKAMMKPTKRPKILQPSPLFSHPYFWEANTIHPELAA